MTMILRPSAVAVIPARGGSKGLPRKNVLPLAGMPLLVHSIRAALESACFGEVVVSTDDEEIADVSREAGARISIRPMELATDTASSLSVLRHTLERFPGFTHYGLLQPTSPLRCSQHVRGSFELLRSTGAETCVAVTPMEHAPQKCLVRVGSEYKPLFTAEDLTKPRQALEPTYRINGAIYLGRVQTYLATMDLFAPRLACYQMPRHASIDIDEAEDLSFAELVLAQGRRSSAP